MNEVLNAANSSGFASVLDLNTHATKELTPHNTSWFWRTKGIDFSETTHDSVFLTNWGDFTSQKT